MKSNLEYQQFLAGKLPDSIYYQHPIKGDGFYWDGKFDVHSLNRRIEETEWAQIALDVEERLKEDERIEYAALLRSITKSTHSGMIDFEQLHMSWQQRAEAMMRMEGKV